MQRTCPICNAKFVKRINKNKCPACKVELALVGPKTKLTILESEKQASRTVITTMLSYMEHHTGIWVEMSAQDYQREIGIYYNIIGKCRRLINANKLDIEVPLFIIKMIDLIFREKEYEWLANNLTSLTYIAGKMFNRIAREVIIEEIETQQQQKVQRQRLNNIKPIGDRNDGIL
jgi:hypothetical protein